MAKVDAEKLSRNTDALLRRVKDRNEVIDITLDGRIIARLIPAHGVSKEERDRRWAALDELATEIGKRDVGEVSAVEMVRDVRRDL